MPGIEVRTWGRGGVHRVSSRPRLRRFFVAAERFWAPASLGRILSATTVPATVTVCWSSAARMSSSGFAPMRGACPRIVGDREDRGLDVGDDGEPEGETASRGAYRGREGAGGTGGVAAHQHLRCSRIVWAWPSASGERGQRQGADIDVIGVGVGSGFAWPQDPGPRFTAGDVVAVQVGRQGRNQRASSTFRGILFLTVGDGGGGVDVDGWPGGGVGSCSSGSGSFPRGGTHCVHAGEVRVGDAETALTRTSQHIKPTRRRFRDRNTRLESGTQHTDQHLSRTHTFLITYKCKKITSGLHKNRDRIGRVQ